MMPEEIWKDIVGYEGIYQVSNFGRVKRIGHYKNQYTFWTSNKIMTIGDNGKGYKNVKLFKNGKIKTHYLHRLIAETFIPNPLNLPEVNHKDGIKSNNHVSNLEWCSHGENTKHAYDLGLRKVAGNIITGRKRIVKIDAVTNEIIEIYNSIADGAKSVNKNSSSLSNVLNRTNDPERKYLTCGGFKWKFATENMKVGDILND